MKKKRWNWYKNLGTHCEEHDRFDPNRLFRD